MGQAKRKQKAYAEAKERLLSSCTGEAKTVAVTSIALFEKFILQKSYTGGCYLTTMMLHRYLKEEHAIETTPVVGFVNDGTDNIMISHAWLEHEGQKTDLTLHLTEHPEAQLPGALLVLDHVLRPGLVNYSYHLERSPEAYAALEPLRRDPTTAAIVAHKEAEHQTMLARANNQDLMTAYIDGAPVELGYAAMTSVLR
ncbi:MAG: hypothetical protein KDK08_26890 [Rhizobiaceae bacterium]|nr:hypothetical protein [Rhizobiaceae bacterium]